MKTSGREKCHCPVESFGTYSGAKRIVGINCWATRRWKLGFGWGHTWLDRFDKTGLTDSFLTRFQWTH
jgi:hypothetical protein